MKIAFLYSDLKEIIYMKPSIDFEVDDHTCLLQKNPLYGLKKY